MPNPLFFLPFLAKNVTLLNAIAAAEIYGHHRAYRRILEGLKTLKVPPEQQKLIRTNIKRAIRAPADAYEYLQSAEVANLCDQYLKNSSVKTPPRFLTAIAKALIKRSSVGKIVDIGEKAASKRRAESKKT